MIRSLLSNTLQYTILELILTIAAYIYILFNNDRVVFGNIVISDCEV